MEPTKTHSKWSPPKPTPIGAHHGGVLQFPRAGTEAVEDLVFTEAVEPFSSGGGRAGHEISSLSLSRAETTDNLEEKEREEKNWRENSLLNFVLIVHQPVPGHS